MLQGGGIDPRARPRETLVQYGRFHADPRDADELLDLVGLRSVARTRYRLLSGGERQRLGLALALVGRPEVLVLDEPTAGMDPEARATTRAIVAAEREAGAAILLTSHDLVDVERLADRIVIIDAGRVVASGTPDALRAGAVARLRFRLDRPLGAAEVTALQDALASTRRTGAHGRPPTAMMAATRLDGVTPDAALVADLAAWCATADRMIVELRTAGGSLEDVYLDLVAAGRDGTAADGTT